MASEDPWIELYRRTVPALYRRMSRRAGGDRALAEDVTQEAWLRLLAHHGEGPPPRDVEAWLVAAGTNLVRNHFRRVRPVACDPGQLFLAEPEPAAAAPAAATLVQWGLAQLRPRQADLLEAHHLDGRPLAELARERSTTVRAIEGRLRRARAALERVLAPHVIQGDPS